MMPLSDGNRAPSPEYANVAGVTPFLTACEPTMRKSTVITAHSEARAHSLRRVFGADRHHDDLAAGARAGFAILEQPQRGLDRVFVERVDDPRRAGQIAVVVLDLYLLRRIGNAFDRNQD